MMYAGYDSTGWESGLLMYGLEDSPYLNYARGGLEGDYSISSDKKQLHFLLLKAMEIRFITIRVCLIKLN